MRVTLAWDTETALIRPGLPAPPLACLTWQVADGQTRLCPPLIKHWTECGPLFHSFLESSDLLSGANVAYDMAVMGAQFPELVPAIFEAYDADRVTDVQIRQKLLDIADGCYRWATRGSKRVRVNYRLDDLVRRHFPGHFLDKDTYRLTYGHWRNFPLSEWPEGARMYPLEDARATLDVHLVQDRYEAHVPGVLADQFRQARRDFWLKLASSWGLRTVPAMVERLARETEALRDECKLRLVTAGLVRPDGTRDLKAATEYMLHVCAREGLPVRRTPPSKTAPEGNVSLDADTCEETDDPILADYARYTTLATVLNKDIKALARGCVYPIHTHFGLAETGRGTSSDPNIQNWGKKSGARECFAPRPGFVYGVGDVDQLELRTLAQVCIVKLGRSSLGEALNRGLDPHTLFASTILGIPYEEGMRLKEANDLAFDDVRQGCKFTNFALPGGVGPEKMVVIARSAGIDLAKGTTDVEIAAAVKYYENRWRKKPAHEVRELMAKISEGQLRAVGKAAGLKAAWFEQWSEMRDYFRFVESLKDPSTGLYHVVQLYTGRLRSTDKYTAACNTWFQGLGADGATLAGWLIAKAEYVDRHAALFGSRSVNHSHDDFVVETPDTPRAHDAAVELGQLMEKGFGYFTPDVRMRVKPYLTRLWTKKAGPRYDTNKRLIPWEPGISNT